MLKDKIKEKIMYISFQERKKREYEAYSQKIQYLKSLTSEQLDAEYVNTKARYESKKSMLSLVVVTVILAILMEVWKYFFDFVKRVISFAENQMPNEFEIAKLGVLLSVILVIFLTVIVVSVLIGYVKELREIYSYLLMIEEVRKDTGH